MRVAAYALSSWGVAWALGRKEREGKNEEHAIPPAKASGTRRRERDIFLGVTRPRLARTASPNR
jgi:hypothetical protein